MVNMFKGLFASSRACQHEWTEWQQRNAALKSWWRICANCCVSEIRLEAPDKCADSAPASNPSADVAGREQPTP